MWSLKRVTEISTLLANITVVVSLSIAVLSYVQQNRQIKKDAAVALITGFNTGEMLAIQRRLSVEFAKLKLGRFSDIAIERSTIGAIVDNMVTASNAPLETQQDIITLVSYLDDIAVCVQAETCDKEVVAGSLGESATRYACLLLPYTDTLGDELLLEGLGGQLRDMVDYETNC
jgi:hypothetical protein